MRQIATAGFTLLEMAIVLTIVGLLVGGIMGGQYIVQQAELQSVLVDFTKYKTAFSQFTIKYGGRPGDITDATEYWGTDAVTGGCTAPTPGATDRKPKRATCNGDGDGHAGAVTNTGTGAITAAWREAFRAWQQMANAGLIGGAFSGVAGTNTSNSSVVLLDDQGQNAPSGRRGKTGYTLYWLGALATTTEFTGQYRHVILYGTSTTSAYTADPALTTREAQALDTKADDGKPGTGQIYARVIYECVTDGGMFGTLYQRPTTAYYDKTKTKPLCALGFKID